MYTISSNSQLEARVETFWFFVFTRRSVSVCLGVWVIVGCCCRCLHAYVFCLTFWFYFIIALLRLVLKCFLFVATQLHEFVETCFSDCTDINFGQIWNVLVLIELRSFMTNHNTKIDWGANIWTQRKSVVRQSTMEPRRYIELDAKYTHSGRSQFFYLVFN